MDSNQHQIVKAACRELQLLARRRPGVQAVMRKLLVRYAQRPGFPLHGRRTLQREFASLTLSAILGGPNQATILQRILEENPWESDSCSIAREVEGLSRKLKGVAQELRKTTQLEPLVSDVLFERLAESMLNQEASPARLPVETFGLLFEALISLNEGTSEEALTRGVTEAVQLMKGSCRNVPLKGGFQAWHFTAAFLGLAEQSSSFQRFQNGWITRDDF